jgi:hypothetical protein
LGFAKIMKILSTRGHKGMVWRQYRRGDGEGSPKTVFRVDRFVRALAHDTEVVQRVGKVRMERAETCLLREGSLA